MRKTLYSWQGQRFLYLGFEGEAGQPLERQGDLLFERAKAELANVGLEPTNIVRTRVFGRTREARTAASDARQRALTGTARATTSSYISPGYFSSSADVGLDLFAMAAPVSNPPRIVSEHEPAQSYIRHLVWEPMVFFAGQTSVLPDLTAQCREIFARVGTLLEETKCSWEQIAHAAFFLHRDAAIDELFEAVTGMTTLSLDNAEIEFVDGYSAPGKLVEMEFTAVRKLV